MSNRPQSCPTETTSKSAGARATEKSNALPILMYHGIHTSRSGLGVFDPHYSVATEQFTRHLDWLASHGFRTVRLGHRDPSARDVVLTFDDGDESAAKVAMPLLVERGMVAEFCVTTEFVGLPGMLNRSEVRLLAEHGMGIQSHGRTHRHLADLSATELAEEMIASKRSLEEWTGLPVEALTVPGGRAGRREYHAARSAGYRYVLNSVPGPNRRIRPNRYLHRLAVTRGTTLEEFSQLVQWSGWAPRRLALRTAALEVPKRVLGNSRYSRLRAAVRSR